MGVRGGPPGREVEERRAVVHSPDSRAGLRDHSDCQAWWERYSVITVHAVILSSNLASGADLEREKS